MSHPLNDPTDASIVARLGNDLADEVREVQAPTALAGMAIRRAGALRRRQVLLALPAAASVVAVAALPIIGAVAGLDSSADRPATVGSTGQPTAASTDPTAAASSTAPTVGTTTTPVSVAAFSAGTVTVGGRRVSVPANWAVLRILTAGDSTVLDVSVVDERFAALVTGGTVRRLSSVVPPLALSQDGRRLAGLAAGTDTGAGTIRLISVPDAATLDTLPPAGPRAVPDRFLGPTSSTLLVTSEDGAATLLDTGTGRRSSLDLPVNPGRRPLAVDPSGTVFVTADARGAVVAERRGDTTPLWRSSAIALGPAAWSPDGATIAVSVTGGIAFLDATTGTVRARSPELIGTSPWHASWENADSVLLVDPAALTNTVIRCRASTGACDKVIGPDGGAPLVLADQ